MMLLTLSHLLTLLPLIQNAIAAAAPPDPSINTTTTTTTTTTDLLTAPPSTPNFSLGPKIPLPSQPDFPLLTMLFLTCEGLFTFAPFAYTSASPSGSKSSGTLRIRVEGNPDLPGSAFQVRHVMWAFWLAAVRQLDGRDYRPGIFVMDVARSSGGAARSVGSIIYSNNNSPDTTTTTTMMTVGAGNGSTAAGGGGGGGGGGIESLVAAASGGVDVTSRRLRRRGSRRDGSDDAIMTAVATRFSSIGNNTSTPIVSFPGFNTTTDTPTPPGGGANNTAAAAAPAALQDTGFYNILITGTSSRRLSLTSVFTTIFETMVMRASLPDRETLLEQWIYTSSAGYAFGIVPPPGLPAGESPPYEAMMGGMANLPRALQSGRYNSEVTFDVVDGEGGERVLQGFLVLDD